MTPCSPSSPAPGPRSTSTRAPSCIAAARGRRRPARAAAHPPLHRVARRPSAAQPGVSVAPPAQRREPAAVEGCVHAERPHHGDRARHRPRHARAGRHRRGRAVAHPGDAQPVARDVGAPAARCAPAAPTTPSSTPPGPTGRPSWRPTTACGAGCPRWSSGRGPAARPGTRWRPSTCGSTTSTWSAASTSRRSSSTCRRAHVFDSLLVGGPGRGGRAARDVLPGGGDWYAEVAPAEYQALYEAVRLAALGWDAEGAAAPGRRAPRAAPERPRRAPAALALPGLGARRRARRARPAPDAAPTVRRPHRLRDLPPRAVDLTVAPARRPRALARARAGPRAPRTSTPPCRARWPGRRSRRWEAAMDDRRRDGRGHAVAPAAHRERALLRPGLLGGALAAAAHRHVVGLAPAVPAGLLRHGAPDGGPAPGGLGGHGARPGLPRGRTRWRGTSRCAGATAVSAASPRPRDTSTRLTTSFPGMSPCDERRSTPPPSLPRCDVPQLACPPVVLRPYAVSDLAMVRQASADPLIPSISSVPRTYTDDAGRAFIERQHARASRGRRLLLRRSRTRSTPRSGIGSIGLWLQEIESGRASIGYWLVAGARGRGLAARALEGGGVVRASAQLAIPRLHLFVEPWNVASARTAEAAGFTREATLRGWERIDGDAARRRLLRPPARGVVVGRLRPTGVPLGPSARLPGCSGTITGPRTAPSAGRS